MPSTPPSSPEIHPAAVIASVIEKGSVEVDEVTHKDLTVETTPCITVFWDLRGIKDSPADFIAKCEQLGQS